jgi:hypothetical protein
MATTSGYEYQVARATGNDLTTPGAEEKFLNTFGDDGWELVAVASGMPMSYYFKREKEGFRSRVMLEQKARVYAERGLEVTREVGESLL